MKTRARTSVCDPASATVYPIFMKFGTGVVYKLSSKRVYRHTGHVTTTRYVCMNFFLHCPHLLSDLAEIRHATAALKSLPTLRENLRSFAHAAC